MPSSTLAVVVLAVWLLSGLTGVSYIDRQGHPRSVWLLVLGPFSMLVCTQRVERPAQVVMQHPSADSPGVEARAGLDGSATGRHAPKVASLLVGDRPCCLVPREVVGCDNETEPSRAGLAAATAGLERAAESIANAGKQPRCSPVAQRRVWSRRLSSATWTSSSERARGVSRRLLGSAVEGLLVVSTRPATATHLSA